MKIDRTKIKRSTTEVPPDCKALIEKLKACSNVDKSVPLGTENAILEVLDTFKIWTYGKCELYHWIDVLDIFDSILHKATLREGNSWVMACDRSDDNGHMLQKCVKKICGFTTLLIEHSFSRTVYNSMEHLTALLNSINLTMVLEVLHLLYMFSKRSNFLTRLSEDKRDILLGRLALLAESWGGKEAGFGLAACCLQIPISDFPTSATTVHLEFAKMADSANRWKSGDAWQVIHIDSVDKLRGTPAEILDEIIAQYQVPLEKQLVLFTHVRLAYNFPKWTERVQLIQARLQALSILVYANAIQENTQQLLYNGLMEELVDILELDKSYLTDIKAAALKTLTSIIHLDRAQNFPSIIDATGAGSYHGFLPVMVRNCIGSLTASTANETPPYPLPLATSLFSFLYHLASYELGGEALVNCGMLESLLKVVNWNTIDVEHITFVTRAVRVIDLITNMDMQAFQAHNGLTSLIHRLELEVNACRKDQPFEIVPSYSYANPRPVNSDESDVPMETDASGSQTDLRDEPADPNVNTCAAAFVHNGTTCLSQRAALLKSMLNFLKKIIQDPAFSDGIRHIMEGPLPGALKHIISNAEYYGASLFILATDVVTVYVFQEPSLLSTLQDSGLTDIVSEALLVKDVPPTREVIATMPNVFSAMCLNSRGLNAFVKYEPFQKLFRMLISPEYLPAMRRRRTAESMGDTASNLGNAVDELMRHQPSLKGVAMSAMVDLLKELSNIGSSPRSLAKGHFKSAALPVVNANARSGASEGGSSDDEEDDDDETSTASHSHPVATASGSREEVVPEASNSQGNLVSEDRAPVPYMDYVLNVMKCLDAILSNNSTDDHCREFVRSGGLTHLMSILAKNTLPLEFPTSPACQATAAVCRSILTLAHEEQVLVTGLQAMSTAVKTTTNLNDEYPYPGSSVLLREISESKNPPEAVNNPEETPVLHGIISIHAMVTMFINICRTGQTDIRAMVVKQWGSDVGIELLKDLSRLYLNLVWESTVLLSLCSGEYQPGSMDFGRRDIEKLTPPDINKEAEVSMKSIESQKGSAEQTPSTTPDPSTSGTASVANCEGMEVDSDVFVSPVLVNSATQTCQPQFKELTGATLQNYAKLIKPVLSASSRLGRALTELFGLLVKLCVGSPLRQRRGHHIPQLPGIMVPGANLVASTLADLVVGALKWESKVNCPVPRITFSICSVGFSGPLLFDEKKFPYHLMLRKFMEAEGFEVIFKTFYWAMSPQNPSQPGPPTMTDHQVEFLESWLNLIEKFCNPKTILDNQHLLQTKSLMLAKGPEFDANAFLGHVHKKAFEAILHLLGQYNSKLFGSRSVETLLSILCYIFRFKAPVKVVGEVSTAVRPAKDSKEIQQIMEGVESTPSVTPVTSNESTTTTQSEPVATASGTTTNQESAPTENADNNATERNERMEAAEALGVDSSQLQHLMEMGFPLEMCIEALVTTSNLLLATDYLLSNGWSNEGGTGHQGSSNSTSDDRRFTALLRLLGEQDKPPAVKSTTEVPAEPATSFENLDILKQDDVDRFTETIFEMCLDVLDKIPESVFRVCELLVAVGQRNGMPWIEKILNSLMKDIVEGVTKFTALVKADSNGFLQTATSADAKHFGNRVHLFTLLFDELNFLCAMITEQHGVLPLACRLIRDFEKALLSHSGDDTTTSVIMKNQAIQTPPWISPLFLMIDLYQKAVVVSNRKSLLAKETDSQWKWFDINSGKWCPYSAANNSIINRGFWDGESTVKITAGRRRYVINFNAMIQLNEETSNRRPITLWLKEKNPTKTSEPQDMSSAVTSDSDNEAVFRAPPDLWNQVKSKQKNNKKSSKLDKQESTDKEKEMPYVRKRVELFKGLADEEISDLINCSVSFINLPIEPEFLHAIMRLCLRLTREHHNAVSFASLGGVRTLLQLTEKSSFPGVLPLANLLIRHVIEDKGVLRYAVEKMIRAKVLSTGASTCKELHYLLRVLAPIACRCPDLFVSVAKEILQVDMNFVTRREEDLRLIVKAMPCKQENLLTSMGDCAKKVIQDLLKALTLIRPGPAGPIDDGGETSGQCSETHEVTNKKTDSSVSTADAEEVMEIDAQPKPSKESTVPACESLKYRRLIPKDLICQLLAESVHSYSYSCKIIAEFAFIGGSSRYVPEDCTALAFLLDKMLPGGQTDVSDKDCSTVVKDLISAMAGCNHLPDAQAIVVSEVKAALQRALAMKESAEKHNRIQALAGLICNMIEACPSAPATQMVTIVKPTQLCMNQVVRLLIRKNVVVDLTRIAHSLDLSSPHMAQTINAALKPLEVISRIVNQPLPSNQHRPKNKTESAIQDSVNNTHTAGTSNSELTRAQGEETAEDADNTEHDISAAAESILDATSESHTHHDAADEREDDGLDDIMDQILDRDPNATGDEQLLVDSLMADASNNRMETEQEGNQRDNRDLMEGRFGVVDHDDDDTSESDSDDSEGENDDDEEDGNGNNVGEEEEDDDDEDEDGSEDEASMDDRDHDHLMDEGFMRFPGMDRDEDLLVVQYGQDENTPVFFTNNASYNFNVGLFDDPPMGEHASGLRLNHPLLTPPSTEPQNAGALSTRGHRAGRARRFQYIQLPRNAPPSIQRLLGPSTAQDVMQLTSGQTFTIGPAMQNPARVLMLDATSDPNARNGNSGTSSYLSNYTALHWWCEEAKVLDGESMHDSVIALKRPIIENIESERDKAFEQRREKKLKEAEEAKKKREAEAAAAKANNATTTTAKETPAVNAENEAATSESVPGTPPVTPPQNQGEENEPRVPNTTPTDSEHAVNNIIASTPPSAAQNPSPGTNMDVVSATPDSTVSSSLTEDREDEEHESDMDVTTEEPMERENPPVPPHSGGRRSGRGRRQGCPASETRRGRRPGLRSASRLAAAGIRDPQPSSPAGSRGQSSSSSPQHSNPNDTPESAIESQLNQLSAVPSPEIVTPNNLSGPAVGSEGEPVTVNALTSTIEQENVGENENADPLPGPSGTQSAEDFRNILGDIDIPEGVDPSFLAALPEEMRQEVIAEHLRAQRLRQRTQTQTTQENVNVADISPDFLAALPPNIQEEVLAQQRLEQQRQVATASNPNDPVDTEAFFQNLQPSLRQAILADMEESQISVLPPSIAAEAQNLRREWESRNRQLLHERFFTHGYSAGSALSSILRNSGMRLTARYGLAGLNTARPAWAQPWPRGPAAIAAQHMLMTSKIKGKQLVDNEALSCLLVLLFLDDPRLNTGRLHRVLRNFCYHGNTRQWVIRSLLTVMERANECSRLPYSIPSISGREVNDNDKATIADKQVVVTPSWLNLSLDAALGCRASVFEIHKTPVSGGKKAGTETRIISIHAQAVPSISKHTLDVLSNLAKSFPTHFLPTKGKPSLYCNESSSKLYNLVERKPPTPPPETKAKSVSPFSKKSDVPEFWEILLKLDSATSSRKGKHVVKGHSNPSTTVDQGSPAVPFEASPFGMLINMLSYGCIRRNNLLTDKLLRLLSLISLGIPDTSGYGRKILLEEPNTPQDPSLLITESHLRLIVEVITSKNCTEEGLEEATTLLLNLSYGPPTTRNKILSLLMEGVRELGNVVCQHIASLQNELRVLRKEATGEPLDDQPSTSSEQDPDKPFKGTLMDRFTKDTVVISANSKNKATYELQLPSMTALTSKTSSQSFFLRLLKVIISLRESIETAIKKLKLTSGSSSGPLGGPLMSSTVMSGDRSLLHAVTAGMPESASREFREAFERVINTSRIRRGGDQPMDVDHDDAEGGESGARRPSRLADGMMVDIDESSDEDDEDVVLPARSAERESTANPASSSTNAESHTIDVNKLLPRLSSLLELDKLWETLSECLLELGHTPDHHAVLVLQPAVEAFFLVHSSNSDKEEKSAVASPRESRESQLPNIQQDAPPVSPIQPVDSRLQVDSEMQEGSGSGMLDVSQPNSLLISSDTQKFLKFAETHRTVLNQILRQSSSNLAEGPFSVLVDHTRVLDFDVKRRYFRSELERLDEGVRREDLAVHVRRSNVFEDSFRELHRRTSEEWKNRFYIVFEGEEGQDAGGLLREWYVIISREIFNPMYALFTISPGDRVTYMINQLSHCNSNHLFYFKFVGRVIAKAIYDNKLLECYFTRSFYKHILGKSVRYTDMESEDYSFYQGLAFLLEHNVADLGYELTFSTEVQEFGVTEVRDLIPNGRNIPVTEQNKMEYIRLVCQMKMTGAIQKQLNAFLEGFYDIIPKRLISIFNEQELELLVSGLPNIDIEDLKANTEYHKYQLNSLQIQWFWRALRSFDQADRAKFLQFVTGTSKVPLQGFGSLEGMNGVQKFQIHRDDRSTDRLPSAHTCFNQLDLPAYETYDKLRSYLLKAIHECSEGFGFA